MNEQRVISDYIVFTCRKLDVIVLCLWLLGVFVSVSDFLHALRLMWLHRVPDWERCDCIVIEDMIVSSIVGLHRVSDCLLSLCLWLTLWMRWGWCNCIMSQSERDVIADGIASSQTRLHRVSDFLSCCLGVYAWVFGCIESDVIASCLWLREWVCERVCASVHVHENIDFISECIVSYTEETSDVETPMKHQWCTSLTSDVETQMMHIVFHKWCTSPHKWCTSPHVSTSDTENVGCGNSNDALLLCKTQMIHVSYLKHMRCESFMFPHLTQVSYL